MLTLRSILRRKRSDVGSYVLHYHDGNGLRIRPQPSQNADTWWAIKEVWNDKMYHHVMGFSGFSSIDCDD
jgi:hypothetical protein